MALASMAVPAPELGLMPRLSWRERGRDTTAVPVFSRDVGVWLLLPSERVLVSEGCGVDCRRVSSEGLSGTTGSLVEGFCVAESTWRLSISLTEAEAEFGVREESSSSGIGHEC